MVEGCLPNPIKSMQLNEHDALDQADHQAPRRPWWQPKTSLIVISAILIAAGFLVPSSCVDRFSGMFAQHPARVKGAFSPEAAKLEQALARGVALEGEQRLALLRARSDLQLRQMLKAGPMSGEDVLWAKLELLEGNAQVDREPTQASKLAMRHELVRRMALKLPRLDKQRLLELMDEFDASYALAVGATQASSAP